MPTISQLVRAGRTKIVSKTKSPALQNSPQKRGVCVRVFTQRRRSELCAAQSRARSAHQLHRVTTYTRSSGTTFPETRWC